MLGEGCCLRGRFQKVTVSFDLKPVPLPHPLCRHWCKLRLRWTFDYSQSYGYMIPPKEVSAKMLRFEFQNIVLEVPEGLLNDKLSKKISAGQYEKAEANAARSCVQRGHRVLELGGGIGYISSICAQLTPPENVITVEANPNTVKVIEHNLTLNGAAKTQVIHAAVVGEKFAEETVLFRVGSLFWGSSIADANSKPRSVIEVPALQISEILRFHRPEVVIIDIEGGEEALFDQIWPRFVRHVLMEIHPKLYEATVIKKIVDCMSQSGLTYDPSVSRGALLAFQRIDEDSN